METKDIIRELRANKGMSQDELAVYEGNRTIAAEKSPFWSKYPFVAWNT